MENGEKAVAFAEKIQPVFPGVSGIVSEHGAQILRRFEVHCDPEDLVDAVVMQEKALQLAPTSYYQRHLFLWRYGLSPRLRFETFKHVHDSCRCVEVFQDALDRVNRPRHPRHSLFLAEIGTLYSARYACYSLRQDLMSSLDYYAQTAGSVEGLTSDRFRAVISGGRLAHDHGQTQESASLLSSAVSLLPHIAWLGLNASKRHAKLVQTAAQVACYAAAVTIKADQS